MSLLNKIHIRPVAFMLHVLAWGIIVLSPLLMAPLAEPFPDRFRPDSILFRIFLMALFYFNAFFLIGKLFKRKKLVMYVSALIFSFILLIIIPVTFRRLIPPPTPPENRMEERVPQQRTQVIRSMDNIRHKNFMVFRGHLFAIQGMAVLLISSAFGLMIKYDTQNKERETETLKSELSFLRSQINPHFMLNTLNNLVWLARKKSDLLEPSLIQLSGIMQYMLYESEDEKVNISQEVEYVKSYIELQKLRFDKDLKIYAEMDDYTPSLEIAPLILIPFVENAFKHGVVLIKNPEINIHLNMKDNMLSFIVKNKLNSMVKEEEKEKVSGIGLLNIKRRLDLIYPNKHRLEITQERDWFTVNLSIKLS